MNVPRAELNGIVLSLPLLLVVAVVVVVTIVVACFQLYFVSLFSPCFVSCMCVSSFVVLLQSIYYNIFCC